MELYGILEETIIRDLDLVRLKAKRRLRLSSWGKQRAVTVSCSFYNSLLPNYVSAFVYLLTIRSA